MSAELSNQADNPVASMVMVYSQVPEEAMTAGFLGTNRAGQGVRISADGLIVTVGYLVIEAEQIWLTSSDGRGSPAYVVAQDYDSGLALLRTSMPIGQDYLQPGPSTGLAAGDTVMICNHGDDKPLPYNLVAKQEFAGRWEYLLDEALFITPVIENWAGAALLNQNEEVCGIGSLMLEVPVTAFEVVPGNMFIPLELVTPYLDELCTFGCRQRPPRPWLGTLIQEYEGRLIVVGIYNNCPAHQAGIEPGDIIVSVNDEPVTSLPEMLRKVWSMGNAGIEIPLTITRSGTLLNYQLKSIDRASYHQPQTADMLN
jgi:S1-C subfamily serine protease